MENRTFYNEILTDHNLHPLHKEKLPDANLVLEGVNPSCGDDIILQLKVEDGQVVDGAFEGSGCAISQASADIMLDLIIGKSEEEARHLADLFLRMIKGEAGENEIEELEETLDNVADYYANEADYRIQRLLALLEPTMLVVLAIFAGIIVVSIYLPIFTMYDLM